MDNIVVIQTEKILDDEVIVAVHGTFESEDTAMNWITESDYYKNKNMFWRISDVTPPKKAEDPLSTILVDGEYFYAKSAPLDMDDDDDYDASFDGFEFRWNICKKDGDNLITYFYTKHEALAMVSNLEYAAKIGYSAAKGD